MIAVHVYKIWPYNHSMLTRIYQMGTLVVAFFVIDADMFCLLEVGNVLHPTRNLNSNQSTNNKMNFDHVTYRQEGSTYTVSAAWRHWEKR